MKCRKVFPQNLQQTRVKYKLTEETLALGLEPLITFFFLQAEADFAARLLNENVKRIVSVLHFVFCQKR